MRAGQLQAAAVRVEVAERYSMHGDCCTRRCWHLACSIECHHCCVKTIYAFHIYIEIVNEKLLTYSYCDLIGYDTV